MAFAKCSAFQLARAKRGWLAQSLRRGLGLRHFTCKLSRNEALVTCPRAFRLRRLAQRSWGRSSSSTSSSSSSLTSSFSTSSSSSPRPDHDLPTAKNWMEAREQSIPACFGPMFVSCVILSPMATDKVASLGRSCFRQMIQGQVS